MKTPALILLLAVSSLAPASELLAQSARQLTRKVVPQPTNQPPTRPTPPPSAVRPTAPPQPALAPAARPVDPEKARKEKEELVKRTIEFQKKRAEQGSPSAQYELGLRYLTGDGLEKDEAQGLKWLQESAKNGHAPAKKKIDELKESKKQ